MTGVVFNIQKFCTSDGPGIRTVVFLKGCPLRCAWCHNAESHRREPELLLSTDKCTLCGHCRAVCTNGVHEFSAESHTLFRDKCATCGKCAAECLSDALEVRGKDMTVDEVLAEVCKDRMYFDRSGGGITLSGGEPFAQREFTLHLLSEAKAMGLNTCVETCGYTDHSTIISAVPMVDLFLWDIKHTDPEAHKTYTGVDTSLLLKNLRLADEMGAALVLRCPIIPEVNDNEAHFSAVAEIANSLANIKAIEIEPYHAFGVEKYGKLGKCANEFRIPEPSEPLMWAERIRANTVVDVKIAK